MVGGDSSCAAFAQTRAADRARIGQRGLPMRPSPGPPITSPGGFGQELVPLIGQPPRQQPRAAHIGPPPTSAAGWINPAFEQLGPALTRGALIRSAVGGSLAGLDLGKGVIVAAQCLER